MGFDPDQPRDADGKWGGGLGGAGKAEARSKSIMAARAEPGSAQSLYEANATGTKTADAIVDKAGARNEVDAARAQLAQGSETSKTYTDKNGVYTPERQEIHDKIIADALSKDKVSAAMPGPGEQPVLNIIGGRGGSGKGWLTGKNGPIDAAKTLTMNPDDFQEKLPGYQGWNAGLYHDEAAGLSQRATDSARELGANVTLDRTLAHGGNVQNEVNKFADQGYKVNGYYMHASPEVAAERAMGRFKRTGRFVPPEYILGSTKNESNFDALRPSFNNWKIYDNNGAAPRLYSEG